MIQFPSLDIGLENNLNKKYFYNYYYYNLFKGEIKNTKIMKHFFVVKGSSPEKFFIIFKKFMNEISTKKDSLFLINAWNNNKEDLYLEPNKEYGFSYLNYFSKAIFNLDNEVMYNLEILSNKCKIAVQVHLYYEDLIHEIINKTNNIPVKFDLYLTITSETFYNSLEILIKKYSNANKFEILIVENKGRDVLPFLNQMKAKYKKYKYICHIHSKKSETTPELGLLWRKYLYDNLLGNSKIVSEILYDFENNKKLGFMFPETFYGIIKFFYSYTNELKERIEFLSSNLFTDYKISDKIDFPAGNMFWAKVKAIFQIFVYDFAKKYPIEHNQTNDTIMHGIERIWLYLVKFNRYKYKILFKYF